MTKPKGYDLFLNSDKEVKASAVKTYMRSSGWVPKVEAQAHQDNASQDIEHQSAKLAQKSKETSRQKSWVPRHKL